MEKSDPRYKEIVRGLESLEPKHRRMFRLMYGRLNGNRPVEEAEVMTIEDVLSEIPDEGVDMALRQIRTTCENERLRRSKQHEVS